MKKERNLALRLGYVSKINDWTLSGDILKKLLRSANNMKYLRSLEPNADGSITIPRDEYEALLPNLDYWQQLEDWMVKMDLRQKGVDMRIGLDIASLTLKKLVKTIVLVAGDSDFVPAAKLARREGIQFILDPLWQSVSDDLFEHIDGLHSGLSKRGNRRTVRPRRS
ncbi:NYN domain-containing protein [Parasphingorhabdus sp. DH2-15]|uniref:NYN domain-containing protein n=1 Tax=Parasphingorhabdus sp. DH2-15 TaxID=3444112 RepID=UPI003F68335D